MISRKMLGTAIVGMALSLVPLTIAATAFAGSDTSGLAALSLQGVGNGALASGDCLGITCNDADICECLTATYTLVGNQGFAKGSLNLQLSVDTTVANLDLPISDVGTCNPATGSATIKSSNGKVSLSLNISGLECPTLGTADVFNGSYVVTGGSKKFSSSSGGSGAINGSQVPVSNGLSQVAITGTVQPTAP